MFYQEESSIEAANELLVKSADTYISKFEFEGKGVASVASNDVTLTPAVSPAFTISALVSTVGINVVAKADGGKLFQGKVSANDANSVTFDSTLMVNVADGAAGVPADWTATSIYDFYVLTPSDFYRFGDYFGHTGDVTFDASEEDAELKKGAPRRLIASALLEKIITLGGINYNVPNGDVLQTILNMEQRGLTTGETEYQAGFNPAQKSNYRIALLGEDFENKKFEIVCWKNQIKLNGALSFSEDGFKSVPYEVKVLSDVLRNEKYDAFSVFTEN